MLAGTLPCSLLAIWPRAAPCGEVRVGRSAPLLEAMRSVCLGENRGPLEQPTGLLCLPPLQHPSPRHTLVPPGSYFGLWGLRGLRVPSAPSSLCLVPAIANPGPGGSRAVPDGAPPRPWPCAGCLPGLSLARWNTRLQDPENLLEHLEEGTSVQQCLQRS